MIPLLLLSILLNITVAGANDPTFLDIDDTGDAGDEEITVDPIDVWPEKIVMDAKQNALLLVWFNTSPPRNTAQWRQLYPRGNLSGWLFGFGMGR